MPIKHEYSENLDTDNFTVRLSPVTLYGWFEHHTQGENRAGGLWFELWNGKRVLTDADGTAVTPTEVLDALRRAEVVVPRESYLRETATDPDTGQLIAAVDAAPRGWMLRTRPDDHPGGFTLDLRDHGTGRARVKFDANNADLAALKEARAAALDAARKWEAAL